jgi:hypothetical protein
MSFDHLLSHFDENRGAAIVTWLGSSLSDCHKCGNPVRPVDPRKSDNDGMTHLNCKASSQDAGPTTSEPVSAAVEARARRSDWG